MDDDWRGPFETVARTLTARGREQTGRYALEGTRLAERALRAGIPLPLALVGAGYRADPAPRVQGLLAGLAAAGCRLVTAPDAALARLTEGRGLGDVVAVTPLPPAADLEALAVGAPLLLVAVDVSAPGNTGALVRTAHGLGATAFVAVGRTDPFAPASVRTARGSLFRLPLARVADLGMLLVILRPRGVRALAAVAAGGTPLPEADLGGGGLAVVVGGEARGLDPADVARLDARVTIPMPAGIDSLSLNAAAAILLYAARRT